MILYSSLNDSDIWYKILKNRTIEDTIVNRGWEHGNWLWYISKMETIDCCISYNTVRQGVGAFTIFHKFIFGVYWDG